MSLPPFQYLAPKSTQEVLKHFHRLWGFPVTLESMWQDEVAESFRCPAETGQPEAEGVAVAGHQ